MIHFLTNRAHLVIRLQQRIYRGRHRNPGVTYQYTVDRMNRRARYRYRLGDWGPCSVTCGRGRMDRRHECVNERGRKCDDSFIFAREISSFMS